MLMNLMHSSSFIESYWLSKDEISVKFLFFEFLNCSKILIQMDNKQLISYSLLTEIKKKQFGLQCENSMNRVEACSKNYQLQSTRSRYIKLIMNLKVHYSMAGAFLQMQSRKNDHNTDIFCKSSNIPINIENYIPNFDEFTTFLQKVKNTDRSKIDFFTFSVFPSILNFFINSPRFDLKLLSTIVRSTYLKDASLLFDISRAFFVSPEFITYCHDVFQPIFSNFQSHFDEIKKQSLPNIKKFLLNLFNNEYSNSNFIEPPRIVAHALLCCKDSFEMFRNSFLHVAFQNKDTLMFYGLFHYSKPPANDQVKIMRSIFDSIDDLSIKIQGMFMNIILKSENYDNSFLKEQFIKFDSFKEYSKIIVSNNDIEFFNSTKDMSEITFHSNTELFLCSEKKLTRLSSSEIEFSEIENSSESNLSCDYFFKRSNQSMFDQKGCMAAYLRHLLQYTDPIPEISEESIEKNGLTLEKFIDDILILRGPIESISKRRFYAFNLKEFFVFQSRKNASIEEILRPILDKIIIKNPDEIKLYAKYYIEMNQMEMIEGQIGKGLIIVKLISSFIDPMNKTLKNSMSHSNYLKYPLNISKEFKLIIEKLKDFQIEYKNLIILMRLFDQDGTNLYQAFLKKEIESKKIQMPENDQLFQSTVLNSITNPKIKFFVSNFLLKDGQIYIQKLNEAFNDNSIFRMIELVNETLNDILLKFDKSPDPAEIIDIKSISIVLSKPKHFQSIYNFCKTYLFQLKENTAKVSDILFLFLNFVTDVSYSWDSYQKIIEKMKFGNHE